MAKVVTDFEFSTARSVIPDEWFNGQIWELEPKDLNYSQVNNYTLNRMRIRIKNVAAHRGIKVRVQELNKKIYVQAIGDSGTVVISEAQ